jgi:hypothetical protein
MTFEDVSYIVIVAFAIGVVCGALLMMLIGR